MLSSDETEVLPQPVDDDHDDILLPRRAIGPRARAGLESRVAQWTLDGINGNTVQALRQKAVAIQMLDRAVHFAVIKAGEILTEVKAQLQHGQFLRWVTEAVDMSPRTAQRYMALYNTFPNPARITHVPLTELYHVAAIKQTDARAALANEIAQITDDRQRKQVIISRIKQIRTTSPPAALQANSDPATTPWASTRATLLRTLDRLETCAQQAPPAVRDEAAACVAALRRRIEEAAEHA